MNYAKIVPCDIANGEGVRVTLFVQGCLHHCPGCQNPTTWDPNGGRPFTDETLDKIVDLLRPDYIQGLTLTGGDPLLPENREVIKHIIDKVWQTFHSKKDIWMWTGYRWEDLMNSRKDRHILACIDVLVDGPYIESKRDISLPYMGSSNQRVIDCYASLCCKKPVLWWNSNNKKENK